MLKDILLILFYLITPAVVIHYAGRFLLLRKAGNVVVVYIIGLIIGNIGLIDASALPIQENITNISILLSLPLLLVTLNFSSFSKMAPKSFISLGLGLISIITVIIFGHYLFKPLITDAWKTSGLLVGVYTGGTPNLASIKEALAVPSHEYLMVHTSDLIYSGAYLLFLMTVGKTLFKKWLPYGYLYNASFKKPGVDFTNSEEYSNFFKSYNFLPTMLMLGVASLIFLVAFGISTLFPSDYQVMIIILLITSIGIGVSFIPTLRRTPKAYELGMYFILVFSLVVSSMADMEKFSMEAMPIFLYVSFTITLSLILHVLLSKLFKIDADTTIITSTALICSPPFVPVIAGVLNNRSIIISGLTIGIIGYAVGNYLGILTALFLKP